MNDRTFSYSVVAYWAVRSRFINPQVHLFWQECLKTGLVPWWAPDNP